MELHLDSRLSLADALLNVLAAPGLGSGAYPLVNLVGPPGMGKSHTLRQLFERIAPLYAVAALDFARPERFWPAAAPDLAPLLAPSGLALDQPVLADLSLSLRCAIPAGHTAARPWLVLIDGLDGLAAWPAIQRALIKPLAERAPALVVVASRAPLSWHFWELRDRCRAIPLPRLEFEETLDIARDAARAPLAASLHALALGHPAAVEALLRHFRVEAPVDGPAPRLDVLSERTRRAVMVIGLLRMVQVPKMQQLLMRFVPGWTELLAVEPRALDTVLAELKGQGQLRYSRRHNWLISPALRGAVADELLARRPELLYAVCRELEALYYAEAESHPLTAAAALNEWLYFVVALPADDPRRAAWPQLFRRLLARRVALGGNELIAQIYRDENLIAHLQRAGCLDALSEALHDYGFVPADLFSGDEDQYRKYVDELLERLLGPTTPIESARLRALLQAAAELDRSFEAAELALLIARRSDETVSGVRRDLALLVDRGCCAYDAATRRYSLDPLVRRLIAPVAAGR